MLPTTQAFLDRAVGDSLAPDQRESAGRAVFAEPAPGAADGARGRSTLRGALVTLGIVPAVVSCGVALRQVLAFVLR